LIPAPTTLPARESIARRRARQDRRVQALDGAQRFPTATTPRCIKGAGVAKAEKSSNEIPHAADYRPVRIP
jgi:hypothetical protein